MDSSFLQPLFGLRMENMEKSLYMYLSQLYLNEWE